MKIIGASFDGSKAYISGKYVLVDSTNDICFEILRKPEQREKMRNSIKKKLLERIIVLEDIPIQMKLNKMTHF